MVDRAVTGPRDGRTGADRSTAPLRAPRPGRRSASEGGAGPALRALPVGQGRGSDVPAARPDRFYAAGWRHNLPQPLTTFIGREREIAEARRLLAETRLLTLTGTGGVGKTRLGHAVAASLLDVFDGGVWVVELAALADPSLVPHALATVLDVREEADRPLTASLASALRPERLLLVLDNCEHLIEACAVIADALLRACPDLRILATSRQALGIGGETTFHVPSLSLSAPCEGSTASAPREDEICEFDSCAPSTSGSIQSATPSEAVRLFVERTRAAVPAFTLTDRNSSAVEQICRRLDGIPLAIELAAARVAVLNPEQIEVRLDDRFRLLSGGSRTALPRYRTLRALIDWSHDLLDQQEKVLLRRLAVFAGGWTLEAAESVCAGDGLAPEEILDLLSGLVSKSLVLTGEDAEGVRYRFLESLREYAAEKQRDAGEDAVLPGRHCDWLLALAERAETELRGPRAVSWLDRLERERENLRAALAWCVERGAAEPGLRLASALSRFWQIRGPYREIRAVLAELLASPAAKQCSAPVQEARMKALLAAGVLAMRQDDRDTADIQYQEALEISRQLGDRRGLAMALVSIGRVARVRGDHPAARSYQMEAIRVLEALGDDFWLAKAYHHLGVAAYVQDDLVTARKHYEACLAIFEQLGDELGIVTALAELGEVAFSQGDLETAQSLLGTSLEMARRIDDKDRIAKALAALAGLAAARSRPRRALRLAAAATALVEATDQRNSPAWHALVERWLEPARRALSAEACAAEQAAGRAMPLDEATEYALSSGSLPVDAPEATTSPPNGTACNATACNSTACDETVASEPISNGSAANGTAANGPAQQFHSAPWRAVTELTQRELEVAALVARGLTNRQIAAELVIAEGTAANHVKHILARLVLDSRVQIAAWAIEHGVYRSSPS
jgi:predicted ATPase/DNA-binding CsgD family transcriptional regulator